MPGKPSKQLMDFMAAHSVDSDEVWEVRAGGTWAIKHAALERIAAQNKITFDQPTVIESKSAEKIVALLITGRMVTGAPTKNERADGNSVITYPERTEWSIGEAAPANNKNAYTYAMAEKRGKDRVILKLLNAHGAVYSDAEADELTNGNGKPATLPKKDAREIYAKMQREVRECQSRDQLKAWAEANKDRIAVLPDDWQDILRLQYEEQMADLRNKEAA